MTSLVADSIISEINSLSIEALISKINSLSTDGTYSVKSVYPEINMLQINFNDKLFIKSSVDNCIYVLQSVVSELLSNSAKKIAFAISCVQYQIQHNGCKFAEAFTMCEDSYVLTRSELHKVSSHPYNYHFYINGDLADGTEDYTLSYYGSMDDAKEYADKHFDSFVLIINTTNTTDIDADADADAAAENTTAHHNCARYNNYVYSPE